MPIRLKSPAEFIAAILFSAAPGFAQSVPALDLKYSFATPPLAGYTAVPADAAYTKDKGFGFDLQSKVSLASGCATGTLDIGKENFPFYFSAKIPPGAYRVTVTLGDPKAEATTTVRSETRRLMLENIHSAAGESKKLSFLVHVRVPQIPGATGNTATVAFKQRERDPVLYVRWGPGNTPNTTAEQVPFSELDWDEKLTLEFGGNHPAVSAVEITPAPDHTAVYLVGDSTMTDQMMEPWAAWGQMFPRFFKEPLLIANYAECGETTQSFIGERRWAKIMSEVQPGDYIFIQFGINDQSMQVDRFSQYFVQFIDEAQAKKAIPVLVTSQNLKRLDANGKAVQTLRNFPDAMKTVAKDKNVPLIDLNEMSMRLYEAIGPGPDKLDKAFSDGTHHSDYGAYELAKCVVTAILEQKVKLPIAQYVVDDWKPFDPAKPDPFATFSLPRDAQWDPAFDSPTKTSPAGLSNMAGAPPRAGGAGGAGGRGGAGAGGRGPANPPATATRQAPATAPAN